MVWRFLSRLLPDLHQVNRREQVRASLGAFVGVAVTGLSTLLIIGPQTEVPLLVAPIGASAVLLFAVPSSPLAQPWSIIGGNVSAALVGILCRWLVPEPLLAAAIAVCAAIAVMFLLRCLHPPGGAVAVTAVLSGPSADALGLAFAAVPIGLNSALLLATAILYNRLTGMRYPQLRPRAKPAAHAPAEPAPEARIGFSADDLDAVLERHGKVVDVDRRDLMTILAMAQEEAFRRRSGDLKCRDLMTRNVVTISPATVIGEAWHIMQDRGFSVLPVTRDDRTIVGMLTREDFAEAVGKGLGRPALSPQRRLAIGLDRGFSTLMPVEKLITRAPVKAREDTAIATLVSAPGAARQPHIAVVDASDRLIGLVTQTDLVVALFRGGDDVGGESRAA